MHYYCCPMDAAASSASLLAASVVTPAPQQQSLQPSQQSSLPSSPVPSKSPVQSPVQSQAQSALIAASSTRTSQQSSQQLQQQLQERTRPQERQQPPQKTKAEQLTDFIINADECLALEKIRINSQWTSSFLHAAAAWNLDVSLSVRGYNKVFVTFSVAFYPLSLFFSFLSPFLYLLLPYHQDLLAMKSELITAYVAAAQRSRKSIKYDAAVKWYSRTLHKLALAVKTETEQFIKDFKTSLINYKSKIQRSGWSATNMKMLTDCMARYYLHNYYSFHLT